MGRVVVVGSSNMDLSVAAPTLPRPGETVLGHSFARGPGGKGSNQAIAARRLGAEVTFVTKLGEDRFGDELRAVFEREGLPSHGILRTRDAPTGIALIVVDDAGRNAIAVAPGANALLTPDDLTSIPGLFDGASHLLCQLETPLEVVIAAARGARRAGLTVVLDPAPARTLPDGAFALVDVLTPNQAELQELTSLPTRSLDEIETAARSLIGRGVGAVMATLGDRGSLHVDPAASVHIAAPTVRSIDTTGCGDAFAGCFVAALATGSDAHAASDLASRAGSFCATRRGVLDGLPTHADLDRELPS